jgi:hypothetical protein
MWWRSLKSAFAQLAARRNGRLTTSSPDYCSSPNGSRLLRSSDTVHIPFNYIQKLQGRTTIGSYPYLLHGDPRLPRSHQRQFEDGNQVEQLSSCCAVLETRDDREQGIRRVSSRQRCFAHMYVILPLKFALRDEHFPRLSNR